MASAMIKSTYSLDPATVRKVERLAERWKVSKSEAVRRVVTEAKEEQSATVKPEPTIQQRLDALTKLQEHMKLTRKQAREWEAEVKRERRASYQNREWLRR
jgi:hypothetical protein